MLCCWHAWLFADFLLHRLVQLCKEEHNTYLSRIVGLIPNLCFKVIESSEECIVRLIGRFFGLHQLEPWSIHSMGAISKKSFQKIFEGNLVFKGVLFHPVVVLEINFLNSNWPLSFFVSSVWGPAFGATFDLMAKRTEVCIVCAMIDLFCWRLLDWSRSYRYRWFFRTKKCTSMFIVCRSSRFRFFSFSIARSIRFSYKNVWRLQNLGSDW